MSDLASLLTDFLNKFGSSGLALAFCVYFLTILQNRLDKLIDISTKMFGIMLTFSKKAIEEEEKHQP